MDLPPNRFKHQLDGSTVRYGMFCGLADSVATEVSAGAGFDWLLLDGEHSPTDVRTILQQLQAAAPYDVSIIVRPAVGEAVVIKQLLDVGVQTLLVPMVESAGQAEALVAAMRYPPAGVRGVGTSFARAARWNRVSGYVDAADAEMCLIAQIESVDGHANIEAIASVDGVDALFVGPSDLAASMGLIGRSGHDDVLDAVDDAIRRIVAAGKSAGVFAPSEDAANRWIQAGATFVAVGSDISALALATTALIERYRGTPD